MYTLLMIAEIPLHERRIRLLLNLPWNLFLEKESGISTLVAKRHKKGYYQVLDTDWKGLLGHLNHFQPWEEGVMSGERWGEGSRQ